MDLDKKIIDDIEEGEIIDEEEGEIDDLEVEPKFKSQNSMKNGLGYRYSEQDFEFLKFAYENDTHKHKFLKSSKVSKDSRNAKSKNNKQKQDMSCSLYYKKSVYKTPKHILSKQKNRFKSPHKNDYMSSSSDSNCSCSSCIMDELPGCCEGFKNYHSSKDSEKRKKCGYIKDKHNAKFVSSSRNKDSSRTSHYMDSKKKKRYTDVKNSNCKSPNKLKPQKSYREGSLDEIYKSSLGSNYFLSNFLSRKEKNFDTVLTEDQEVLVQEVKMKQTHSDSKVLPGSLGEMLLKRQKKETQRNDVLGSTESASITKERNENLDANKHINEIEQNVEQKICSDKSDSNFENSQCEQNSDDEQTLRYMALQSTAKFSSKNRRSVHDELVKLLTFSEQTEKENFEPMENCQNKISEVAENSLSSLIDDDKKEKQIIDNCETDTIDMEISNDEFSNDGVKPCQDERKSIDKDTAIASNKDNFSIPVEWAYMIPPPTQSGKSDLQGNNINNINSWCYNQNLYVQSMEESTNPVCNNVSEINDPKAYQNTVQSDYIQSSQLASKCYDVDTTLSTSVSSTVMNKTNLTDTPYCNQSESSDAGLRDNHALKYESFMASVQKTFTSTNLQNRDNLVQIDIKPMEKLQRTLTNIALKSVKRRKRSQSRKRNRRGRLSSGMKPEGSLNECFEIAKEESEKNSIETLLDLVEDDDEDILRARLLNEMATKNKVCQPDKSEMVYNQNLFISRSDSSRKSSLVPSYIANRNLRVSKKKMTNKNAKASQARDYIPVSSSTMSTNFRKKFVSKKLSSKVPMSPPMQPLPPQPIPPPGFTMARFPPVNRIVISLDSNSSESEEEEKAELMKKEAFNESSLKPTVVSRIDQFIKSCRDLSVSTNKNTEDFISIVEKTKAKHFSIEPQEECRQLRDRYTLCIKRKPFGIQQQVNTEESEESNTYASDPGVADGVTPTTETALKEESESASFILQTKRKVDDNVAVAAVESSSFVVECSQNVCIETCQTVDSNLQDINSAGVSPLRLNSDQSFKSSSSDSSDEDSVSSSDEDSEGASSSSSSSSSSENTDSMSEDDDETRDEKEMSLTVVLEEEELRQRLLRKRSMAMSKAIGKEDVAASPLSVADDSNSDSLLNEAVEILGQGSAEAMSAVSQSTPLNSHRTDDLNVNENMSEKGSNGSELPAQSSVATIKQSNESSTKSSGSEGLIFLPMAPTEKPIRNASAARLKMQKQRIKTQAAKDATSTLVTKMKRDMNKMRLSKKSLNFEISSLLDKATKEESLCQMISSKIVKLFSQIELLRKERKDKLSFMALNLSKVASLQRKVDNEATYLAHLQNMGKEFGIKEQSYQLELSVGRNQQSRFASQKDSLQRSLLLNKAQEQILTRALNGRVAVHQASQKIVMPSHRRCTRPLDTAESKKKFKLDNRQVTTTDVRAKAVVNRARSCSGTVIKKSSPSSPQDKPKNGDRRVSDFGVLCPFDLLGRCNDDQCRLQHTSENATETSVAEAKEVRSGVASESPPDVESVVAKNKGQQSDPKQDEIRDDISSRQTQDEENNVNSTIQSPSEAQLEPKEKATKKKQKKVSLEVTPVSPKRLMRSTPGPSKRMKVVRTPKAIPKSTCSSGDTPQSTSSNGLRSRRAASRIAQAHSPVELRRSLRSRAAKE